MLAPVLKTLAPLPRMMPGMWSYPTPAQPILILSVATTLLKRTKSVMMATYRMAMVAPLSVRRKKKTLSRSSIKVFSNWTEQSIMN